MTQQATPVGVVSREARLPRTHANVHGCAVGFGAARFVIEGLLSACQQSAGDDEQHSCRGRYALRCAPGTIHEILFAAVMNALFSALLVSNVLRKANDGARLFRHGGALVLVLVRQGVVASGMLVPQLLLADAA